MVKVTIHVSNILKKFSSKIIVDNQWVSYIGSW